MRTTELSRSQQIIISALLSTGVRFGLIMLIVWWITDASLLAFSVVVALALLLTEVIQSMIANEQQERAHRKLKIVYTNTQPEIPALRLKDSHNQFGRIS